MRKIKIGILGCANIAKRSVIPNMVQSGNYEIVCVASRDINKAIELTKIYGGDPIQGYSELLLRQDIDSVYIPLPTGLHYKWVMRSLRANKHVFVEKSIATSYDEALNIIKEASERKLCVFENFMFPYHSQFEFVRNQILNGAIGEIKLLRSSFGFPVFDKLTNIRYDKKLGGGALLDAGAYTLMAAQLFLGFDQNILASTLNNSDFEVDFHGAVLMINKDKIPSQLAFGLNNFYQNNIELWGTNGKITIERAFTAPPGYKPTVIVENKNGKQQHVLSADNHFVKILNSFHQAINKEDFSCNYNQIKSQALLIESVRINQKNYEKK
jgi:dTDP-3,4-didehydro-2,6-dideoxy-alpha-D-glucose 3-reductase